MCIPVVPRLFVAVMSSWRHELVENLRQISLQTGLEFNGSDRPGAPNVKQMYNSCLDPARSYDPSDLICDIVHVTVAAGGEFDPLLVST